MSENIKALPNRFESYVIEKPSEYRVLNADYCRAFYKDKNNNAICVDIDKYTIHFKYEPEETTRPFHFEYVRDINLSIKNEEKLLKRSKKIVKKHLKWLNRIICNVY